MSATMRDVARLAGVSVKTVSNVVNGYVHVSAATRARVAEAIDALGYQLNFSARSLSLGRTGMIALAVPQLRLPYFAELSDEVILAAEDRGLTVLIEQTGGVRQRELDLLTSARRRMTDGLVFSPLGLRSTDAERLEVDYPMVLLGERPLHRGVDHVVMANVGGARAVTEHLLSLGRRRIALVGSYAVAGALAGSADETIAVVDLLEHAPTADLGAGPLRTRGFLGALRDAGLRQDPTLCAGSAVWTRRTGADAMAEILDRGGRPDAVFALNDVLALGAMRVLFERGLRVPEDVVVAGFDNIEDSRYSRPSLTTVEPGRTQIARTAVDLLARRLGTGGARPDGPDGPTEVVADFRVEVRESTGV